MSTPQNKKQAMETRIGSLEFTHDFANGYPTDETVEKLYDERDFQHACQAYPWSLSAVAFTLWQRGTNEELGAKNGQIVAILSYEARQGILIANALATLGKVQAVTQCGRNSFRVATKQNPHHTPRVSKQTLGWNLPTPSALNSNCSSFVHISREKTDRYHYAACVTTAPVKCGRVLTCLFSSQ
jgi:hypothetical protein